jgi:hypothetical protein
MDHRVRGVNRDVIVTVESNHRVVLQAASLRVCLLRHVATATVRKRGSGFPIIVHDVIT